MQEYKALPPPLIELAIEAKNSADFEDLRVALMAMTSEDPLLRIAFHEESGQIIVKGMDEPIMRVEVVTPLAFAGSVMGDLRSRRGLVESERGCSDGTVITATVPLANVFGYREQLRSFSRGHATFTMAFERYEPTPSPFGGRPPPAAAAALRA